MRKLLVLLLCAAVAAPAVALAADTGSGRAAGTVFSANRVSAIHVLRGLAINQERARRHRLAERRKRERARRRKAARAAAARSTASPALQAIANCESGGDPHAIGGGGAFRGKYQFDYGTWASVGGSGDPAAAPEAEQDRRAAILYARSGATPWPVCGQ